MFKTALMMTAASAVLLATAPASATVTLSGTPVASSSPFGEKSDSTFSWVNIKPGVWAFEPGKPTVFEARGGPAPITDFDEITALPEPMSWGMMLIGLTAVGWTLRTRKRSEQRIVSFV